MSEGELADPLLPELLLPVELLAPDDGWLDGGSTPLESGALLPGGSPLELSSPLDSGIDVSLLLGSPDEGPLDGDDDPLSLDEAVSEPLDVGPDELSATDELTPDDGSSAEDERSAEEDRSADDELPPLELGSEELETGKLPDGSLLDADSDDDEPLLPELLEADPELEVPELLLALDPEELTGGSPLLGGTALDDGAELPLELDAEALDEGALDDSLAEEELDGAEELDDAELEESLLE